VANATIGKTQIFPQGGSAVNVAVDVVNTSAKEIYAYSAEVAFTRSDGSTGTGDASADLLTLYYNAGPAFDQGQADLDALRTKAGKPLLRGPRPATFAPGQTFSRDVSLWMPNGGTVVATDVRVKAVIFGDETVLGEGKYIEWIANFRSRDVLLKQALANDLRSIITADDVKKAAAGLAKQLRTPRPSDPKIRMTEHTPEGVIQITPRENEAKQVLSLSQLTKEQMAHEIVYLQGLADFEKAHLLATGVAQ